MNEELDQLKGVKVNQQCKFRLANRSVLNIWVPVNRQTCGTTATEEVKPTMAATLSSKT